MGQLLNLTWLLAVEIISEKIIEKFSKLFSQRKLIISPLMFNPGIKLSVDKKNLNRNFRTRTTSQRLRKETPRNRPKHPPNSARKEVKG